MRFVPAAVQAARASRSGTYARQLVWIAAKNRGTGAIEAIGLWTGDDHQTFTIGGQSRDYYGAGNVLDVPVIQASVGLSVRSYDVTLSGVSPEVQMAIRGYDPRFCPAEIRRAEFDMNGNLLDAPERVFLGWVDGTPIVTPSVGGSATAALRLVSSARVLTVHGSITKSDEMQQLRSGDRFRRYSSITKAATTYWGEKRKQNAGAESLSVAGMKNSLDNAR